MSEFGPGAKGKSNQLGIALLIVGGLMLATRMAPGNLFFELMWLAGYALLASVMWKSLENRVPMQVRIGALGVIAILAAATLSRLAGFAFLSFISLPFILTYWFSEDGPNKKGWALIPAGVLMTVAATAGVNSLLPRWDAGTIFLLGMTATFTYIYLLPKEKGGAKWALWPALAWAAITLIANDPTGGLGRWLLPMALIGAGVVVLGWARGRGKP